MNNRFPKPPVRSTPSIDDQIDQVSKTARRVEAERDIYRQALREIILGRYFFGDRPRQIAKDALAEAELL